jgi:hypothetical protein
MQSMKLEPLLIYYNVSKLCTGLLLIMQVIFVSEFMWYSDLQPFQWLALLTKHGECKTQAVGNFGSAFVPKDGDCET